LLRHAESDHQALFATPENRSHGPGQATAAQRGAGRMKVALISTVFNEGEDIYRWAESLRASTRKPDEFVIVDGGSTDGTPERLKKAFSHGDFPQPKIIVEKCTIARGRNLAFKATTAEIVASIDAGSRATPQWLDKLVEPILKDPKVQAAGGWRPFLPETEFQKRIERYCQVPRDHTPVGAPCDPSGGNIAFRRAAFEAAGMFPEWMTFAGEDYLFTMTMNAIGCAIYYQPDALNYWDGRRDWRSYVKMVRRYGYGLAEMRMFPKNYWGWLLTTLCPPLIFLSKNPVRDFWLRWLRNANGIWGWVTGRLFGHKPPADWKFINGCWYPPVAQKFLLASI
jgi:cellulose synthase/poly-beta-1,6-N-acetylglucosamine synthase-like glycosyltransferase